MGEILNNDQIPRGTGGTRSINDRLTALERITRDLRSKRTQVVIGSIIEGGTIGQGVGQQLTETVQEKIVVNGDNLAVDALDGRVITGSTVQTDPEPEVGSKMTNGGVTVHGKALVDTPGTGTQAETKMRAVMDSRRTKWSAGESDKWPGVWFESTPPPGSTPPQFPPGVTLGASSGLGLILQSANNGVLSPNAEVSVSPGVINISASPVTGGVLMGFEAGLNLSTSGFGLGSRDENGVSDAYIANTMTDRKLRIYSTNGIDIEGDLTINGEPYTPGGGGGTPTPTPDPEPAPLVLTGLITNDQPAVAENDTAIIWNTVDADFTMWGGSRDDYKPTRLYANRAGMYFLTGNVTFSNMGGGMRGVWFRVNGNRRVRGQSNPPPSAQQMAEIDAHNYVYLAQGDYVEVMATVAGAAGAVSIKANQGTLGGLEWKRP